LFILAKGTSGVEPTPPVALMDTIGAPAQFAQPELVSGNWIE
jgi:hypothetical protein